MLSGGFLTGLLTFSLITSAKFHSLVYFRADPDGRTVYSFSSAAAGLLGYGFETHRVK